MNEITTMHSVTRIFARIGGPRRLAIGLAVVCAALASAVWASARPAPSSGATPHEIRYLLQTREHYPSDAALQADRAVLLQRLTSSGIAHARLLLWPPRRIEVILPAGRSRSFLTTLLTETGSVTLQDSKTVALPLGGAVPAASYPILARNTDITANATQIGRDPLGQWVVDFALQGKAAARVPAFTTTHIGQYMAVALDGRVINDSEIVSAIPIAAFEIAFSPQPNETGPGPDPTVQAHERAQEFFVALRYGPLPAPLLAVDTPRSV
jgi:preprotein translocase subunit SecD